MLIKVVGDAGKILRDNAFVNVDYEWKKEDDPVTELDRRVENYIKDNILKETNANFIGEEYGLVDNGADYTFIIDPIDGTKSFMRKDFLSSVSVAAKYRDTLVAGVVYDFMKDIMYVGCFGETDILYNNQRVPFPQRLEGKKIRITIDGDDLPDLSGLEAHDLISLQKRGGSIALQMAHLAANAYDGMLIYSQGKGNTWDVAGGYHLLRERDFYVTDIEGKPFDYNNPTNGLIALRKHFVGEVMDALNKKEKKG
jgi:myo-inositol-1(or 4)-monophosphatase